MSKNNLFTSMILIMSIVLINTADAQNKKEKKAESPKKAIEVIMSDQGVLLMDGRNITIGDAIRMVLVQNKDTLTGAYDVAMSDSLYKKYQKRYSPFLNLEGGTKYEEYPEAMGSMVGKDQKSWDISASIAKMFSTATTLSAGIKHEYAKTTYRPIEIPGMGDMPAFGDPDYHKPVMFVSIQQELLKNAFGYSERRQQEILKNTGRIQRDTIIYQLSGLVVEVIVDYWTVVINSWALDNAELQLKETKRVRRITAQNVRLGLAERFDLNYYNTLVAASEAKVVDTKQKHSDSLKKLLRTLNLEEDIKLEAAILTDKLPKLNEPEALKTAYKKRADYNNALLSVQNAKLELEMYSNEGLPSIVAEFNISSMGQRDDIPDAYSDTSSAKYPSWEARVKVTYPLDDMEQKTNERDARYKLEQAKIQLDKYKRLVRDDIASRVEHIQTYYKLYRKMKEARVQAEIYYRRLLRSLRRGRFTAAVVKNGLDNMVDSRQRELESLVQYNITLLQFVVSKNELFNRYNIDVNEYIPKDK